MYVCLLSVAPYPLLLAAYLDDAKQMRTLINSKASVDGVDSKGRTAAMYCAQEDNVECLQLCVEAKCNLELRDNSVVIATVFFHMHVIASGRIFNGCNVYSLK